MFNAGFYPSTPEVIELMLAPHVHEWRRDKVRYLSGIKRILEPSAGKADIADYLCEKFDYKPESIFCCEIDEDLIHILQGKGYPVIEKDFLRLAEPYQFDLVIMNPPFTNAADHILKAWDVLKMFGGEIVAQCNVETIDNPCDFNRQHLARLIAQFGSVERIGRPYRHAERTSDVEVAIVRLKRTVEAGKTQFGGGTDYEHDEDVDSIDFDRNELASANMLEATVASYNAARQVVIDQSGLDAQFYFYTKGTGEKPIGTPESIAAKQKEADASERNNRAAKLNKDLSALKTLFWNYLFRRTSIADIATSKVQAEFAKFVSSTGNLSFTSDNIQHVFALLAVQKEQIKSECVTQVFDKLCSYDGENIIHREGWVTNDNYRVNRKVIVPIRSADYDGDWRTWWDTPEQVIANDIDKAMCFVTGKSFLRINTIHDAIVSVIYNIRQRTSSHVPDPNGWNGTGAAPLIESEFFKIRIFKKGTIHLTFKSDDVWEEFNIAAAEGKNWIGAGTAHKSEKNRTAHRKSVQKEYQAVYP